MQSSIDIISKLSPLSTKLINQTLRKFQNNSHCSKFFNKEQLTTISNEITTIIIKKINTGEVDERGMYNYFKKSFNNKCVDLYREITSQKRNNITLHHEDISAINNTGKDSTCYFNQIELLDTLNILLDLFKKYENKDKAPYGDIIRLIYEGYKQKDIMNILDIKPTTFKRYRSKAIAIAKKHLKDETDLLRIQNNHKDDFNIYLPTKKTENKNKDHYSIETFYPNTNVFAHIVLYKYQKEDKILIQEEFCLNEDHYESAYISIKKILKNLPTL